MPPYEAALRAGWLPGRIGALAAARQPGTRCRPWQPADATTREVPHRGPPGGRGRALFAPLSRPEVAAALNEARAEHVVYDPTIRYTGAVAADGSLYGWTEGAATAVAEPRLTERIVERALHTGARLTPVEGVAKDVLRDAGGIAALLRW